MIHDAERVPLHESHPDLAERSVRDPLIAVLLDLGARQPCGPTWQVSRIGSELVDLGWRAGDVDADMLDVVHETTSLGRAGSGSRCPLFSPLWTKNAPADAVGIGCAAVQHMSADFGGNAANHLTKGTSGRPGSGRQPGRG